MSEPMVHLLAASGAGREAEHVGVFFSLPDLQAYLYALAKVSYEREYRASFESGYEVSDTDDDRWRAAVEWAVETGREEWSIVSRQANYVKDGRCHEPRADIIHLDQAYLSTLRGTSQPTP